MKTLFIVVLSTLLATLSCIGKTTKPAIKGYDLVSYFTENAAKKGNKAHAIEYKGANYYFTSSENLEIFKTEPSKYLPAYGGYCAYGVTINKLIKINPKVFKIHNGKLYLQYNKTVSKKFNANIEDSISLANTNWKTLSKK